MTDCLFCKIAAGEIPSDNVYEDDKILVFKDIYPKADVHLLMIPKEHYTDLPDIQEKDPEMMNYMMKMVPVIAKDQGLDNGFRTIINTGRGGGQEVFHIHIHIMAGPNLPGFR